MSGANQNKNVLIAGGSGLIGKALAQKLTELGYNVSILSRRKGASIGYKTFMWNPDKGEMDAEAIVNKQYLINLAGESIAGKYWTRKQKKRILDSRINAIHTLSTSLNNLGEQPVKFISASAIGYYGTKGNVQLTETSSLGEGFLANVCDRWEQELNSVNTSVIKLRIGMVLSQRGGYLAQTLKILKTRVNVLFGNGDQYVSWIHIDDLVNAIAFVLETHTNSNVYNLTSPSIVQSNELNKAILNRLGIKSLTIRLNEEVIRRLLGSFSELLLSSQNVYPQNLVDQGFEFSKPNIEQALKDII